MASRGSDLRRLTQPRAIAVIGASASPGKVGYAVMEALGSASTSGSVSAPGSAPVTIIPVHPTNTEVLGRPVVHEIARLPDTVDVAVIATGADAAVDAAAQCADHGVPFVVVLASGFSETGADGAQREARLREIAAATGTRILGPNTLGYQIPGAGIDTIFVDHAGASVAGGSLVLISQSGSVAVEALLSAVRYGFGIHAFFGLGNKVDLGEIDLLTHYANDPAAGCIAFYIEDLSAGREFLNLARSVAESKPVIAIKAGRTATGASAASSHTGRLSGSDRVIDGALRQHLIQRVQDDEELCDVAKALTLCPVPRGNRIAILSPAGGYGVMLTDTFESRPGGVDLAMAGLSDATRDALRSTLLGFASVCNPVDLTASVADESYARALELVLADDGVDLVVCVFFMAPPGITRSLVGRLSGIIRAAAKPVVVLAGDEDGTGEVLREFHAGGVAAYPSLGRTVCAVRNLERRRRILELAGGGDGATAQRPRRGPGVPLEVTGPVDEFRAKQLLGGYGIATPESLLVGPEEPVSQPEFPGPYVVKVCSAEVQHKTERGGVLLSVGVERLQDAVGDMRDRFPGAAVLVEEMVAHSGFEFIIGAFRDPELGPCVMVGAGGILAELHQDVAFRLLPCSRSDAEQMIDELVVSPALTGYRGLPVSRDSMVEAVLSVGELVEDLGARFRELDLNPVVLAGEKVVALDAALVIDQ